MQFRLHTIKSAGNEILISHCARYVKQALGLVGLFYQYLEGCAIREFHNVYALLRLTDAAAIDRVASYFCELLRTFDILDACDWGYLRLRCVLNAAIGGDDHCHHVEFVRLNSREQFCIRRHIDSEGVLQGLAGFECANLHLVLTVVVVRTADRYVVVVPFKEFRALRTTHAELRHLFRLRLSAACRIVVHLAPVVFRAENLISYQNISQLEVAANERVNVGRSIDVRFCIIYGTGYAHFDSRSALHFLLEIFHNAFAGTFERVDLLTAIKHTFGRAAPGNALIFRDKHRVAVVIAVDADTDKAVAESIAQLHHSGNAARTPAAACACVFFYDNVAHNLFLQYDKRHP